MDRFTAILIAALVLLGGILILQPAPDTTPGDAEYVFFYLPTCPHCHEQMDFHKELTKEFPDLTITEYDVSTPAGRNAYLSLVGGDVRTPVTIIGNSTITGFGSPETTGEQIRQALNGSLVIQEEERTFFGRDASSFSLPALALALGFLDGFNPCAMWMLVYLLTLVAPLPSKRKRWLIVGVFLAASAILYFLFMTAWLNVFTLIGVLRPVQVAISLFAIGFGIHQAKEWYTQDKILCTLSPARKNKYLKAQNLVTKPLSITVFLGIIGLAFAVNSVEFLCSAGIPAIFTGVLALADISVLSQYGLIALYILMYMIDDLIVFLLAMFAINKYVSDKYMHHTKIVSAGILVLLGVLLAFFPHLLL